MCIVIKSNAYFKTEEVLILTHYMTDPLDGNVTGENSLLYY
jgi:hypothetical protein